MTTIVARRFIKKGETRGVVLAADTQVTDGYTKLPGIEKIFSVSEDLVLGSAGRVRVLNVLRHGLNVPKWDAQAVDDPERWVVTKLVPAMQKALSKATALGEESGWNDTEGRILVVVPGMMAVIGSDFSVDQTHDEFITLGTGSDVALGAFAMGATPVEAVAVAGQYDVYTGTEILEMEVKW